MRGVHVARRSERGRRPRCGRGRRVPAAAAGRRRPTDASDGAADSGVTNLVTNPGFETGGGGCGPGWTSYGSILTRSTTAHGGASSCQICPDMPDSGNAMQITATTMLDVKAGQLYSIEAWLRTADGEPPTGAAGAQIYVMPQAGMQQYYQASTVTPSASWTPSNGSFSVQADGKLEFDVHVYYPNGGCVLVDDVGVYPAN